MDYSSGSEFQGQFLFIAALMVAFFIAIAVYAQKSRERRRTALMEFAGRHGFAFHDGPTHSISGGIFGSLMTAFATDPAQSRLMAMMEGFSPFDAGRSRTVSDLVHGPKDDRYYFFFSYRYTTGSGKNSTTHHYGVMAVRVPLAFLPMDIRPETIFDRIGGMLGLKDLQFEMEEFNRAYHVSAENQKAAYDIIHPGMIEFLLAIQPRHWQFAGPMIVVTLSGGLEPTELDGLLYDADQLLERIPAYVKEDIGFVPTWRSPLD